MEAVYVSINIFESVHSRLKFGSVLGESLQKRCTPELLHRQNTLRGFFNLCLVGFQWHM